METKSRRESNTKTGSKTMQKRLANSRQKPPQLAPDLTDFMNDMFFGTVNTEKKGYNLTGNDAIRYKDERDYEEEEWFERSNRSSRNSKMTEEWLDEARRLVASSPTRRNSQSKLVGSPRFASANERFSLSASASILDRRDPLSRSARRLRAVDSFSGEILSKVHHSRNKSEPFSTSEPEQQISPASAVQKWISNILNPPISTVSDTESAVSILPQRKSRFHTDSSFSSSSIPRLQIPSSLASDSLLSPPKTPTESTSQRKTLSSSTCSNEKIRPKSGLNGFVKGDDENPELGLNGFLKEQRRKIQKIWNWELDAKAKVILSGPSNSTSSMVAAVCYAWLLEYKMRQKKSENGQECVVVPVMNMQRGKMRTQRQVAWLFYHLGLDATSILFTDEVDLESLMMAGQISILVVGKDVLKMSDVVGSQCTILTDNYCEDAYHLLQTPLLKNLLLAGILLDTKNLESSAQSSMTRDVEAVQLLSVGSIPNYRNELYDQLMQDQKDGPFLDALKQSYGKPPDEGSKNNEVHAELVMERNLTYVSPHNDSLNQQKKNNELGSAKTHKVPPKSAITIQTPARGPSNESRGKNKFSLSKWFGFGSK